MFQSPIYACVVYLAVVSLAGLASLKAIHRKIRTMNDTEKAEFAKLNESLENVSTVLHNFREDNNALRAANEALTTKVAELEAQLADVPPPPVDDTAEVVAAVQVAEAKVAEILNPTAPPAAS